MSEGRLSGIELFAFDAVTEAREHEPRRAVRRYGLLKLSCGTAAGFGVCLISEGFAPVDPVRWSVCFGRLRGLTPEEASAAVSADRWGARERHPAQYALLRGALADLLAALEARRAGARLLLGLGAAGLLGGIVARASGRRPAARSGPASAGRDASGGCAPHRPVRCAPEAVLRAARGAAAMVAERKKAPASSVGAGSGSGGSSRPDDMLRQLGIAAAIECPSSDALMDLADSYYAIF
ncbi:hypothetical protein [Saccharibacillus alkalitolerans]|uniref:Uncharacterized protein n=1 Tax=Saccharibacillus alkalitolerans TaxID=2705290 RepID=A0ABX0F8G8_9BACL|nr:hypothetical protein [Saccharibacillus alkalitolerans]NGZ77243.1 hypothetical protein [Saccharibacillus alkalitolerans]